MVEHVLGKDEVNGSKPFGGLVLTGVLHPMREIIQFQCTVCNRINYSGTKDKKKSPERIETSKYCPFDRKHTAHKEMKK